MAIPQLRKPAMPHIIGSTTPCTSAQAIAASTALPPAFRISAPASFASGCAATIIERFAYRIRPPRSFGGPRVADPGGRRWGPWYRESVMTAAVRRAVVSAGLGILVAGGGCSKAVLAPEDYGAGRITRPPIADDKPAASSRNATAARMATRYVGTPYVWAGASPS